MFSSVAWIRSTLLVFDPLPTCCGCPVLPLHFSTDRRRLLASFVNRREWHRDSAAAAASMTGASVWSEQPALGG